MGITKNRQTKENIIRMAKAAFPQRGVPRIAELTEGMCNAAYKLTFEDGFQTILKIASPIKTGFMTNECNLMEVGKLQKQLSEVTGDKFGLLGDSVHQFDNMYEFIYFLLNNVLNDAERRAVATGVSKDRIFSKALE